MSRSIRDSDETHRASPSSEKAEEIHQDGSKSEQARAQNVVQTSPKMAAADAAGPASTVAVDIEKANVSNDAAEKGLDWDGLEDPENPWNWSPLLRQWHIVPPALISFAATLGSSIYTPGYTQVEDQFGVSSTAALLPLSLYVLALGCGPIIAAPLSETYGRRVVYLVSPILGCLFTLGVGLSSTFAGLVILRFLAGACFSPALAIGAGTIADVYPPISRAGPTALYILSPFLGPALGPVIGAFVSVRKGWAWTQWTLIFFAIFAWLTVLTTRETYKPIILARRRVTRNLPDPPSPFPNARTKVKVILTITLLRPVYMLVSELIVSFLSLYVGFNFAVLFSFFAAFPYIFGSVYNFTTEQSGLVFLSIGIGCVLAIPTTLLCNHFIYKAQHRAASAGGGLGVVAPEYRLFPAMIGSFGLPIGLFWFAWTARAEVHWVSPVLAAIPFAWGNLSIFISAAMYLVDAYQAQNGASAMAANGLLRYILGAAFPLFTLQMYQRLTIPWATSLLAFVTVALMPIPWILFKYGHVIRQKSKFAPTTAT